MRLPLLKPERDFFLSKQLKCSQKPLRSLTSSIWNAWSIFFGICLKRLSPDFSSFLSLLFINETIHDYFFKKSPSDFSAGGKSREYWPVRARDEKFRAFQVAFGEMCSASCRSSLYAGLEGEKNFGSSGCVSRSEER